MTTPAITWDPAPAEIQWDAPSASKPNDYRALARRHAQEQGIDPNVFEKQIEAESSFNPKARSPVGAMGLGQLMPDTAKALGVTDPYDPEQNLRAAARYMRQRIDHYGGDLVKAIASYNGGDGAVQYAHRHGTYEGWGNPNDRNETHNYLRRILGDRYHAAHDTREADFRAQGETRPAGPPLAHAAGAAWSALNKPLGATAKAATGIQWDDAPKTAPAATKAPITWGGTAPKTKPAPKHSMLEQIGALVMGPVEVLPGAAATGEWGKAWDEFRHDPATAREHYGLQGIQRRGFEAHNPNAQWLEFHPVEAGILQGAADWWNPGGLLVGKGVGKVAGAGVKAVERTSGGRWLLNVFSPMRDIAAGGGREGKRALQAGLTRTASQSAEAQQMALKVFGDLTPDEREEVVHLHEGTAQAVSAIAQRYAKNPERFAVIAQRAKYLTDIDAHVTAEQVRVGTLDPAVAAAKGKFFSRAGAYEKNIPAGTKDFWEAYRAQGRSGPMTRETSERTARQYDSLWEAQQHAARGGRALKTDFDVLTHTESFLTRRLKNVAFEDAMKTLPSSMLVRKGPRMKVAPQDLKGQDMLTPGEIMKNAPQVWKFIQDSPTLSKSYISRDLFKWLDKNSTRLYEEPKIYPQGTGPVATVGRNALKAWDGYNNTMRTAIVTNPLVHPVWNLAWNSLGAGMPVHRVAGLVTRNVVSTFGGQKLLDRFLPRAQTYQQAVRDAVEAGATAEMKVGGRDTTTALGQRWKDLKNPGDYARKAFSEANAWNMRHTFGPEGEQAFSTALFQHLQKQGFSRAEAAGQVREALGNYQNVNHDPSSFDGRMTRVLFFYPWLKGNTAFWVRKLATNPRAALAPADAARMNNALAGDPSEKTSHARDYQWDLKGGDGAFYKWSPLLPQRILTDVQDLASGDPTSAVRSVTKVVGSHLQPGPRVGLDYFRTGVDSAAHDPQQPMNFNTVWDKDAPPGVQHRQMAAHAAGHLLPIPLAGFQVGDALRQGGVKPDQVGPMALGAAGLGYSRHDTAGSIEETQIRRARSHLEQQHRRAMKIGKTDPERASRMIERSYATYERQLQQIEDRARKRADKKKASVPSIQWDH